MTDTKRTDEAYEARDAMRNRVEELERQVETLTIDRDRFSALSEKLTQTVEKVCAARGPMLVLVEQLRQKFRQSQVNYYTLVTAINSVLGRWEHAGEDCEPIKALQPELNNMFALIDDKSPSVIEEI